MSTRLSARTSKTRWRQRKTAAAALPALMAAAALVACNPADPDRGTSAAEPSPAKVSVEFPDNSALEASVENIDPSDEMQSAVTAAMRVNDVASLELDGDLPAGGAEVSFTREDRAVPADGISVIAHWNDAAREWEPLETTLSEDRRTLTATASQLSVLAVIDAVGSAGDRTLEPNQTDEPTRDEEAGNWRPDRAAPRLRPARAAVVHRAAGHPHRGSGLLRRHPGVGGRELGTAARGQHSPFVLAVRSGGPRGPAGARHQQPPVRRPGLVRRSARERGKRGPPRPGPHAGRQ